MISEEAVDAYNSRLTIDTSNPKKLTPSQRDRVIQYGSQAETLLKSRELAMFIHYYKFEINDAMTNIRNHNDESNAERIAFANHLSGIDGFITSLKRAVYNKNKMTSVINELNETK